MLIKEVHNGLTKSDFGLSLLDCVSNQFITTTAGCWILGWEWPT